MQSLQSSFAFAVLVGALHDAAKHKHVRIRKFYVPRSVGCFSVECCAFLYKSSIMAWPELLSIAIWRRYERTLAGGSGCRVTHVACEAEATELNIRKLFVLWSQRLPQVLDDQ